ncbi:hypothetical protein ACFX19_034630 [Malus domestica]
MGRKKPTARDDENPQPTAGAKSKKKAVVIEDDEYSMVEVALGVMASAFAHERYVSGSRLGSSLSINGGKASRHSPLPDPA